MSKPRRDRSEQGRELLELLRRHSFKHGRFVLASGRESDFFIDCKLTLLTGRGHLLVGELLLDALRSLPACDAVAGVELGGCPLASAVSLLGAQRGRAVPALYVRKAQKDHGTRRLVEGPLVPGQRVVILEDVVTSGGSTLRAVETLRAAGTQVVGVAVVVDRLEGGAELLAGAGIEVASLFTRHDFIPPTDDEDPLSRTIPEPDPEGSR